LVGDEHPEEVEVVEQREETDVVDADRESSVGSGGSGGGGGGGGWVIIDGGAGTTFEETAPAIVALVRKQLITVPLELAAADGSGVGSQPSIAHNANHHLPVVAVL